MKNEGGLKIKGIAGSPQKADKPLVTIVTSVFNGKKYLEETILSVLSQSYDNIEYIIIDGGSTDGTIDIIKKYEGKIDYWLSEPDSGMYEAINKGLKIAQGDILAYLNSDDLYYSDTVKTVVQYFQEHLETELVYGQCDFINEKGQFLYRYYCSKFRWKFFISRNSSSIAQPTTFWRRVIHKKIGYFDTTLKLSSDFDFYIKTGKICSMDYIKTPLSKFRIHNASLSATQGYRYKEEIAIIQRRYECPKGVYRIVLACCSILQIKLINMAAFFKRTEMRFKRILENNSEK